MISDGSSEAARGESSPLRGGGASVNPFTAADVAAILRERGWLNAADVTVARVFRSEELALQIPASEDAGGNNQDLEVWLEDAAAWLGSHAADGSTSLTASRDALGELLSLIFLYDAETILQRPESHVRSEEHTSELQSPCNLVCRLLLEKKKKHNIQRQHAHN